jgi:hypothetical protein
MLPLVGRLSDDARLDGVERADPVQCLAGDRRLLGAGMDIVEVAPACAQQAASAMRPLM